MLIEKEEQQNKCQILNKFSKILVLSSKFVQITKSCFDSQMRKREWMPEKKINNRHLGREP